jgi:cytosine/adenosine deaminase-related metal-dependent hydrolase
VPPSRHLRGVLDQVVIVEGVELDLQGLKIQPGLINAHDHLHFALFPRLGSGPWINATAWAHDIYRPDEDPIRTHRRVPKHVRMIWGGLRNLLAGVTTVSHHDPWHEVFDGDFPVRVVKQFGYAHSLEFTKDVRECFDATPPGAPFLIHLGEGTDASAAEEVFRLHELGALDSRTVLIHAVGLTAEGWDLVRRTGSSVIWCPRSNLFTLGRTLSPELGVPMALGTDSPITAPGDLLDELRFVSDTYECPNHSLRELVTTSAEKILRLPARPEDWIAAPAFGSPPELVVIGKKVRLMSPRLLAALPERLRLEFSLLKIEDHPPVFVRWNIPQLVRDTREHLGSSAIRLAGREVLA